MLLSLKLDAFVIFDKLELDFSDGMTVITGVTGSGKSVIFDAIEFAFGNKLNRKIDTKTKPATVEMSFRYQQEIINIKHIKAASSKFFINDVLASRSEVQDWQQKLVTYQRQNQHTQSLDNNYQRTVLDRFAKNEQLLSEINDTYYAWHAKKQEKQTIETKLSKIDLELNAHFLKELEQLAPDQADWLDLNEKLSLAKSGAKNQANSEKSNAIIQEVISQLSKLQSLNQAEDNISSCINQALIAAEEAAAEIVQKSSVADLSEYEIEQLETRLQTYFQLARKHKVRPEELTEVLERYQAEVELAVNLQGLEQALTKDILKLNNVWHEAADKLAKIRHDSGEKLAIILIEKLKKLNMHSQININFALAQAEPGLNGGGVLEFLIATKPKQPLKPIGRVVSGGEAARIGLVMQEIFVGSNQIYLMDEVDVGVSGAVASAIGLLLNSIAKDNQVICITHTPQVAAIAQHHIAISDAAEVLTGESRVKEIAAMLCHDGLTNAAIMQAEELLA